MKEFTKTLSTEFVQLAEESLSKKQYPDMNKWCNKAIQTDETNAAAYYAKAGYFDVVDQRAAANEQIVLAVTFDPTNSTKKRAVMPRYISTQLGREVLNPYTYSQMSELAYYDDEAAIKKSSVSKPLYDSLQNDGWSILATARQKKYDAGGYMAIAFIHNKTKQIVVAHRGINCGFTIST
jgi:hypothetical protein